MFFIGATGHLLTLILTVCLPFVFILSGKQSINISGNSTYAESYQVENENTFNQHTVVIDFHESDNFETQLYNFLTRGDQKQKIPLFNLNINKIWCSIGCCGNKAPPVLS